MSKAENITHSLTNTVTPREASTFIIFTLFLSPGAQEMLVRKEVGNPADYFDKTFAEYQKGFSANGVLKNNQLIIWIIF